MVLDEIQAVEFPHTNVCIYTKKIGLFYSLLNGAMVIK